MCWAQAPATFSTPTIGANLVLLGPEPESSSSSSSKDRLQIPHLPSSVASDQARPEAATGELALVPPMLGASQRLLNRDHYQAYFQVQSIGSWQHTLQQVYPRMLQLHPSLFFCENTPHLTQGKKGTQRDHGMCYLDVAVANVLMI